MIINLLRIYSVRQEKEIPQTTVTENAHLKFTDLSVLNAEGNLLTKTGICSLYTIKMAITEIIPLMVLTGKICAFTAMKMSTAEDCLLIISVMKNRFFKSHRNNILADKVHYSFTAALGFDYDGGIGVNELCLKINARDV
jgi:hypothetical protein